MRRIRTNFSWIRKYQSAENIKFLFKDIDAFLKTLPVNSGKTAITIVLAAWGVAAVFVLTAIVKADELSILKKALLDAEMQRPKVPTIQYTALPAAQLTQFAERAKNLYPNLRMQPAGNGRITISAGKLESYNEWRYAINHLQNMTKNVRVEVDTLCAGRECRGQTLNATLKINIVSIR